MDPKNSKCFTCKWGLCMLQENSATIDGLPGLPGITPEPQIDWSDDEEEEPKKITETRICSLCYWNPTGAVMESPIINVAIIKDCSRYEKRETNS